MKELFVTLAGEGPTDELLLVHLTWLLERHTSYALQLRFIAGGGRTLPERIADAIVRYPCNLLCIHRDADAAGYDARTSKIHTAVAVAGLDTETLPVAVVPVRTMEAWLLFDEAALRFAAGNPKGRTALPLPQLHEVEALADPKQLLHATLRLAAGKRLLRQSAADRLQSITRQIRTFAPLLCLPAFRRLDHDIADIVARHHWV